MLTVETFAAILSIVALIVTIVGFFASLKFYRDGMSLQRQASEILSRIEEKARSIQTQVFGMFDKTLDAAIGRTGTIIEEIDNVNTQLESTATKILESAIREIGQAGEKERKKLSKVIEEELDMVRSRIADVRENVETIRDDEVIRSVQSGLTSKILWALSRSDKPLGVTDIAKTTGLSYTAVHPHMKQLVESGAVKVEDGGFSPIIRLIYTKEKQ